MYLVRDSTILYERNAMGWMVEGCLRPKAMIHLSLVYRDLVAYNRHDSCIIAAPFSLSFDCLVDGRKKGSYRRGQ
jgi:hypothetical protein